MKLLPLPALTDNYIWLLHNGQQALVVDPGDARPVLEALQQYGLTLQAILVTHHHGDHTGGIDALRERTGATVYGPARENIPKPLVTLDDGACIEVLGLKFSVLWLPGHTAGHIAYFSAIPDADGLLFCGDTLFSGGCGRLFEGTPAQMLASLDRLAALPATCRVCCTHEYTLSNLKFAREIEPENQALREYQAQCAALRAQGLPTLPSDIGRELQINPFMRSRVPAVMDAARRHDPALTDSAGVFACLRQWKNVYQ